MNAIKFIYTIAAGILLGMPAVAVADSTPAATASFRGAKHPGSTSLLNAQTAPMQLNLQRRNAKGVKAIPPAPDPADKIAIIDPLPELPRQTMTKTGWGWAATEEGNMMTQNSLGSVNQVVRDGDKIYLSNPMSLIPVEGWLEGTVEGDRITLKLPQYVQSRTVQTPVGQPNRTYDDYILALDYGVDEEGGWYFPCPEQTYVFIIQPDGTFIPEDNTVMLGHCVWVNPKDYGDDESEPQWDWQGSGDIYESLVPVDDKVCEVPSQVNFEPYNLVYNTTYFPVEVGFDGADCYIKGLCNFDPEMSRAAVKGSLTADNKITFPTGQYFGISPEYLNTIFFMAGESVLEIDDEDKQYRTFKMGDAMTFDFDAEKKVLSTTNDYCTSVTMTEPYYFNFILDPVIRFNDPNAIVTELLAPIYWDFYPQTEYDGFILPNQPVFIIPEVSADKIPLSTDRIFYQVFVDDELFTFYPDEYDNLEEPMTDVPFGYNDDWDFYGSGAMQYLYVNPLDVESLAVRTIYRNVDGSVANSPMLYFIGGTDDPNAVDKINGNDAGVVSTKWFDLTGRHIQSPAKGISIRVDHLSDGTTRSSKIITLK